MKKIIAIFTGTRAEYGLLSTIIEKLQKHKSVDLRLIVSGMHCSPEFGLTYKEIEENGHKITEKIEILLSSDTATGLSKSTGLGLISFAEALERQKPDLLIILGDRFEALAMSQAALFHRIPIAHINGGEATYGLIDEAIRHSISKMSHLHFVSTDLYKKRMIQLGENPKTVFNVGSLGVENALNIKPLSKTTLEKELSFTFQKQNVLITFHPVTLDNQTSQKQINELLSTLDNFPQLGLLFTKANADTDSWIINTIIEKYCAKRNNAALYSSLGMKKYLSCLNVVDFVIGNSSSGIIEVPSFKIPTINIGDRQKGRVQSESILNCKPLKSDISATIAKALSQEFRSKCKNVKNIYEGKNTSDNIIKTILSSLEKIDLKKIFYDL